MKLIREIIGREAVNGDIGIEIECEGAGIKVIQDHQWITVNDGSLRGHYPNEKAEFVLIEPLPYDKVEDALDSLAKQQENARMNFSFRTSVHIHCNVLELTEAQLMNFIYTYYLLEDALMSFCGEHRIGNRFCLRISDSDGCYDVLAALFSNGVEKLYDYNEDELRYAALNLAAVRKYGSLEFRGMRGTIDTDVLMPWISAIYNMRKYAMSKANVLEIYDDIVDLGASKFFTKVLGRIVASHIRNEDTCNSIMHNLSLTIDLPHFYRYFLNIPKKEEKKKESVIKVRLKNPIRLDEFNIQDMMPIPQPIVQ